MTKQARKQAYWHAMFHIEAFGIEAGLCLTLYQVTGLASFPMSANYPELYAQKPLRAGRSDSDYWFRRGKAKKRRLSCLSAAIDLCEQTKSK